jgi:hypothetical protein
MKRILALLSIISFVSTPFAPFAFADSADHFEIEAVKTAAVGEAIDITVKAVAKDGSIDKNYNGSIFIFVDKDSKATVPYGQDGYTFTSGDAGKKTFSKGLSFTKEGKMLVNIGDLVNTSLNGTYIIDVTPGSWAPTTPSTLSEKISIISPESGTILSSDSIEVVGTTKKNSKVQLWLSSSLITTVTSDDQGQFIASLKNITQSENILQVKVLDGNDKVIGESQKIVVKKWEDTWSIKNFSVKQGLSVEAKSSLDVSFEAQPKLSEVRVMLGDFVENFKETKDGVYEGKLVAPSATGSYDVSVTIKNDLGKSTTVPKAATLKVIASTAPAKTEAKFENIKIEQQGSKLNFQFNVVNPPAELSKFKILYGTGKDALTTERITYDRSKIGSGGLYTWYIDGVSPATYFVKVSALDKDGAEISGLISSIQEVAMTLNAAGSQACIVGDVGGIKVISEKWVSIISWKSVENSKGYKVYKKSGSGELEFVADTKDPMYKIYIASGAIKYEDFAIKALCSDGKTLSPNIGMATKVQTGPGLMAAMLLIALIGGYWYVRRQEQV